MRLKMRNKASFKDRVLVVVSKIPKGKTLTYKQVAAMAGSPNAYRAVGNIMSKNKDPKVPCHRVIKTSGETGGYSGTGGRAGKVKILKKEGAI